MGRSINQGFVDSCKRKAKRLEHERPVLTHSQALDLIAKQEGYENWSLLVRAAGPREAATINRKTYPYKLYLRGIAEGSGMAEARLSTKYPATQYGKHEWIDWKIVREVGQRDFTRTARFDCSSESDLSRRMVTAQRIIAFMDATDLRASYDFRGVFGSRVYPGAFDHPCIWKDAEKRYILTVEPYVSAGRPVQDWFASQGWSYEVLPKGFGIWNPCDASCSATCIGHTQLIVVAPKLRGGDLQATVRAILSMPRVLPELVTRTAEHHAV